MTTLRRFPFSIASALATALLLVACGGGGGTPSVVTAGDSEAPKVTALNAQASSSASGNTVTLSATATDNTGATAYCFKTNTTAPLANDACFQASAQKTGVTLAAGTTQYVFARDAAGNVSAPLSGPCSKAGLAASDASSKNTVCAMTDKGEIVLELEAAKAPVTVTNFLQYVNAGYYNGTAFHRIISTFMVQGGGFTVSNGSYTQKTPGTAIQLERTTATGLSNLRGTIAMARSTLPNSATSQFFINVVDNLALNATAATTTSAATDGYAVFGKVISGLDTLDALKAVPVQNNGLGEISQPVTPVQLQWVYQLK